MTGLTYLPLASEDGPDDPQRQFKGVSKILGPRWAHLPTLTIGLFGVQIFWSVEMSYASPYLLSLGLSKSNMAVVFLAGPLSGLIMQPLIGVLADNSSSRFGRRRPYMMLGTCICVVAMLLLGFTRSVASIFTGWNNDSNDILTVWFAVLAIFLIDFSINAVQAVDRALLVDTLPSSTQASGNAWAARMLGLGSVVGFFVGNINLPNLLPFLGSSQLEVLAVVVSLLLFGVHMLMAVFVKERVLVIDGKRNRPSFRQEVKDILVNIRTLPRVIRQICIIQFFAWIAWFPVLFYSTIYVGDLYKRANPAGTTDEAKAALDGEATRLGSRALFYSALVSLFVNFVLPMFVSEAAGRGGNKCQVQGGTMFSFRVPRAMQIHLATLWAMSHLIFASCMFATFFTHSVWGSTLIITITGFSWAVTQWAPFSLLAEAILTEPASETAEDAGAISLTDTRTRRRGASNENENERTVFLANTTNDSEDEDEEEEGGEGEEAEARKKERRRRCMRNSGAQVSLINIAGVGNGIADEEEVRTRGTLSSKAGIILGIHNIFVVIPQFLVTGFAAILFAIFDPQKPSLPAHRAPVAPGPGAVVNGTTGVNTTTTSNVIASRSSEILGAVYTHSSRAEEAEGHTNSIVYIFRIGGVAALLAFVLCWRLAREIRHR